MNDPKPCPLCNAKLGWTTTDEDGDGYWWHPFSACPLHRLNLDDAEVPAWNRRPVEE